MYDMEENNTDDLLESLKTILQTKAASLEKTLASEPTNSASKLFDTIYQSEQNESTTGSGRSQKRPHQMAQATTKKVAGVSSTESTESHESEHSDDTELSTLSSLVDRLKKGENERNLSASESSTLFKDLKNGTESEGEEVLNSPDGPKNKENGHQEQNEQDRLLNNEKNDLPRNQKNDSSSTVNSVFSDVGEEIEKVGKEDKTGTGSNIQQPSSPKINKSSPSSPEINKQNPILNAVGSSETKTLGPFSKLDEQKSEHDAITFLDHASKANAFRGSSGHLKTRNVAIKENNTRTSTNIMGKVNYEAEKESNNGKCNGYRASYPGSYLRSWGRGGERTYFHKC